MKKVLNNTRYAISCRESRIESNRSFYGSFYLGPFLPGQSITLANAIRRTLLSELKGIAIVSVQIEGVLHEYSSIPGVRDSVLDILLNLKEVVLKNKYKSKEKNKTTAAGPLPQIGYLRVRGPGIVRAADLKLPPFIQMVDPNQYIATLASDGVLNMKFLISEGRNFISQNDRLSNKDASFNSSDGENPNEINVLNNSFHLKKRNLLLKKIKEITTNNLSLLNAANSKYTSSNGKNNQLEKKKSLTKDKQSNFLQETQGKQNINIYSPFKNNILHIDAVFSPITKVNYIIEYSEHKTIDSSFSKSEQINDFLNLVKPLKNTLSDLSNENINSSFKRSIANKENDEKTIKTKNKEKNLPYPPVKGDVLSLTNKSNNTLTNLTEGLEESVFSLSNKTKAGTKSALLNNIIFEIWTNGSLHPREALFIALKELNQLVTEVAGLKQLNTFGLKNYKYERNYQKLDLVLNNYNYQIMPLNNLTYSSNYTIRLLNDALETSDNLTENERKNKLVLTNKKENTTKNNKDKTLTGTVQFTEKKLYPLMGPEALREKTSQSTIEMNSFLKNGLENDDLISFKRNKIDQVSKTEKIVSKKNQDLERKNTTIDQALDISYLNISLLTYTLLKRKNINTIGDLVNKTKKELLVNYKLTLKCLEEIDNNLYSRFGIVLS